MNIRNFFRLLTIGMALTIAGCGGGGGGGAVPVVTPPATKAIVKLATTGTLPAGTTIGVVGATITYPTTKGLSIAETDVVPSGVAAGGYVQANVTVPGEVILGNLTATSAGFPIGEFATMTFSIAPGNSPVAGDFAIKPGSTTVADFANILPVTSASVVIQSVTFQ